MAALDFPNSPTTNQVFTSGGSSWTWDGVKWIVSAGPGGKPLISGNNLADVQSVPTSRSNLGLGTMATQYAASVAITGGTITGTGIDACAIGGTTRSTGAFTTLSTTGTASANIMSVGGATGGTIYVYDDTGNGHATQLFRTGDVTYLYNSVGAVYLASWDGSNTATFPANMTVNGTATMQGLAVTTATPSSKGANAGWYCVDRDSASIAGMIYGSADVGRLWRSDVGDCFTFGPSGNCTTTGQLTVGTMLQVNGTQIYAPTLQTWGANFIAASGYPLIIQAPSGQACYMGVQITGTRLFYNGMGGDQIFRIYDASASHHHIQCNPANNQISLGGETNVLGDNGLWGAGMLRSSTVNGYIPDGIASTTAITNYSAFNPDVANAQAYLLFFTKNARAAAVGSITTDGTSTFYNTTSDGRHKDNVRPLAAEIDVGALIDAVEPVAFEWLTEPDHPTGHGFVAQDLYEVAPKAVRKGFDDHELHPWSIDFSKLVPYMVAEMQQMRKRLAELEAGHG
jgi:hypothetical protein